MTMLDLFERRIEFALCLPVDPCAEISEILLAVRRQSPISQPGSKILWIGKFRLKMKFRQYSIWLTA